jgi:hypothetical protein
MTLGMGDWLGGLGLMLGGVSRLCSGGGGDDSHSWSIAVVPGQIYLYLTHVIAVIKDDQVGAQVGVLNDINTWKTCIDTRKLL